MVMPTDSYFDVSLVVDSKNGFLVSRESVLILLTCQFFKKRGYPDSAVTTGKHRAHEIDRDAALQTSQNEETNRIPFTLIYHPQNFAIKNDILKNFKILRSGPETKHIFPLPPLISFKRDKNLGNFLVRSAFKSDNQPGILNCKRTRCKTCPSFLT